MTIKVLETSVSQLIKDIDPFEVKQAIGECKSNLDKATKVEHLGSKSYLMHLCLRRHSYYFVYSTDTKAIDYFVRYREVDLGRLLPVKPGRQVLVRRTTSGAPLTAGIAAKVFWNYLFPQYQGLATDNQQTDKGQEFWQYAIKEAFERGKTVRVINTNDRTFVEPKNLADFRDSYSGIWGTTSWFQRMAVAIF